MNALSVLALAIVSSGGLQVTADEQARLFQSAVDALETRGDYEEAIALFERATAGPESGIAARALLELGICLELVDPKRAPDVFARLLDDFPDERNVVNEARRRLARYQNAVLRAELVARGAKFDVALGAVLPDGSGFTTVSWPSGELAVYDASTDETSLLTADADGPSGELALHSVPSSDGVRIAYAWALANDAGYELRIIDRDGTNRRVLVRDENAVTLRPDGFSADGSRLAVVRRRRGQPSELLLVDAHDGEITFSKELDDGGPLETSLSQDARYLVYDLEQNTGSTKRDLFLIEVASGKTTRLVSHPANDLWPAWTPDGRAIVFYSDRTGVFGLWRLDVDGARVSDTPEAVRQEIGNAAPLGFTRDGTYYYALVNGDSNIFIQNFDSAVGRVVGKPRLVDLGYTGRNLGPSWSPDGNCLVYASFGQELFVLPQESQLLVACGAPELQLTREIRPDLSHYRTARWSPSDNTLLVQGRDRQSHWGLFGVDIETGAVATFLQEEHVVSPRWAVSGGAILYVRATEGVHRLMRRELASETEEELFSLSRPARFGGGALSPDGTKLALTLAGARGENARFVLYDRTSGDLRTLHQTEGVTHLGGYHWSSDGHTVYFVRGPYDLDEERELARIDVESGMVATTGLRRRGLRTVAFNAKQDRIAFVAGWLRARTELWKLENLLR